MTEFYINLLELPGQILKFEVEVPLGDIRPDAVCDYAYRNMVYQFFIEVHLSTVPFDQSKYEMFYEIGKYKQWYKVFPRIVIVSDRKLHIQPSKLKYIQLSTKCEEINNILM